MLPVTTRSFQGSSTTKKQLHLFFIKKIGEICHRNILMYIKSCIPSDSYFEHR